MEHSDDYVMPNNLATDTLLMGLEKLKGACGYHQMVIGLDSTQTEQCKLKIK